MTAPAGRCGRSVYWWADGLTGFCGLPLGHPGAHCDGLYQFDGHGLRVPQDQPWLLPAPLLAPKPAGPRPLATCAACARNFTVNADGSLRYHHAADSARTCPGSRRPPQGAAA